MITAANLSTFAPRCDAATVAPGLAASAEHYEINTLQRVAHWLAQLSVESFGFTKLTEDLNYSAQRLCEVWPGRFPTLPRAEACAGNPEVLAEAVYADRMGNDRPGDGAAFLGRGWIELTGRWNYARYAPLVGEDLVAHPELAAQPDVAAKIAGAFWSLHGLNQLADAGDIVAITRAINGGLTDLDARKNAFDRAMVVFA